MCNTVGHLTQHLNHFEMPSQGASGQRRAWSKREALICARLNGSLRTSFVSPHAGFPADLIKSIFWSPGIMSGLASLPDEVL
jgi:hypothetical protein